MGTVGVRELKIRLSHYLHRVQQGERITVTARAKPIAVLGPAAASAQTRRVERLLTRGLARWDGGKPRGAARPVSISGPAVAEAVTEDRR